MLCEDCGRRISRKVRDYSLNMHGRQLCMDCQNEDREESMEALG